MEAIKCCACCKLTGDPEIQVYTFEEEQSKSERIKNLKFLDFFYHAPPKTAEWRRIRSLGALLSTLFAPVVPIAAALTVLLVDLKSELKEPVEVALTVAVLILSVLVVVFANVDVVVMRLATWLFVLDLISLFVVVLLLILFGEGFHTFGVAYFVGTLTTSYAGAAREVDGRLNVKELPWYGKYIKFAVYTSTMLAISTFRVAIFYKQVTVKSNLTIAEIPGSVERFTVRDFWEFWVDILVLRLFFQSLDRLLHSSDKLYLGASYGSLTRKPGEALDIHTDV